MKGRKPLFDVESLEIGQSIELKGRKKQYATQYANNFNRATRLAGRRFVSRKIDNKILIVRES